MKIIKVGCGEYRTCYLHNEGTVYSTLWNGKYSYMQYPGISGVVDITGGQYTCLCWTKDGRAYELGSDPKTGGPWSKEITITGKVVYGQMFNQAKLLVNELGNVFYLAESSDRDALKLGASTTAKPVLSGWQITKIAVGEPSVGMLLLTKNTEVLQWLPGQPTATKVIGIGAMDIEIIGRGVYVADMGNDLHVWGNRCNYVGMVASIKTPTRLYVESIKWPIKKMVGNWNTLHVIDANNDMWAIGENIMGEIGNGKGCKDWRNYKAADGKTSQPFAWNWLPGQMLENCVKLDGKWNDVFTSGSMAFYLYAIDTNGKLYAWGRNKKRSLGNGQTLPDNDLDTKYPNWSDVWYPTPASPDTVTWQVTNTFDPATAANNAPWTPIPPPPPTRKLLVTVGSGGYTWDLFDDGTAVLR